MKERMQLDVSQASSADEKPSQMWVGQNGIFLHTFPSLILASQLSNARAKPPFPSPSAKLCPIGRKGLTTFHPPFRLHIQSIYIHFSPHNIFPLQFPPTFDLFARPSFLINSFLFAFAIFSNQNEFFVFLLFRKNIQKLK
jgi:hypothetical protein